ncbi:hypothetical protein PENTCL1PPCAC_5548 [Pristionchus entomophagus]|uniref:Secreted protein n=1 Tax=Pristionchus entomophagus TaxID=358040 RepID=A0AAV5SL99_9BILA|nr:hypothetical protein PENTCL1PPCAC_5548 [Pristionchus entomophagus]
MVFVKMLSISVCGAGMTLRRNLLLQLVNRKLKTITLKHRRFVMTAKMLSISGRGAWVLLCGSGGMFCSKMSQPPTDKSCSVLKGTPIPYRSLFDLPYLHRPICELISLSCGSQ